LGISHGLIVALLPYSGKILVHEVELLIYPGIEASHLMDSPEQVSWFYLLTEGEATTLWEIYRIC
jgi:hypothetical protein